MAWLTGAIAGAIAGAIKGVTTQVDDEKTPQLVTFTSDVPEKTQPYQLPPPPSDGDECEADIILVATTKELAVIIKDYFKQPPTADIDDWCIVEQQQQ